MIGIINLNKPQGKTSHDMVYFIRKQLRIKQVGHTGTLDPLATGVLPILVGKATKLSDFLIAEDKEYIAGVKLGIATDTGDITGNIIKTSEASVSRDKLLDVLNSLIGELFQTPPMYSALKIDGKKLCDLARRGITVERKERKVTIFSIDLLEENLSSLEFKIKVSCSKGTYIRTLCETIGEKLGTCATMLSLARTKSGIFSIENSYTPEQIEQAVRCENTDSFFTKIDDVLSCYEKISADAENEKKLKNGIRLRPEQLNIKNSSPGDIYRIYNSSDDIICLSESIWENDTLVLKHLKSFY